MNLVQPTLLQPMDDRPSAHPDLEQLPPSHDPVLAPSQSLHLPLKKSSGQLNTHRVSK